MWKWILCAVLLNFFHLINKIILPTFPFFHLHNKSQKIFSPARLFRPTQEYLVVCVQKVQKINLVWAKIKQVISRKNALEPMFEKFQEIYKQHHFDNQYHAKHFD